MLSRFTSKRARHYALNWFNCLIVCPFRAKSGKYYSRKSGKLMQLRKEMTAIALGFYLIRRKLQLLQALVNILWRMFNQLWPTCSVLLKYFFPNPRVFPIPFRHFGGGGGGDKQSVNGRLIHRPRCAGLVMFVHSSAMTQIKAHLMGKHIATNCWLNKETLWRLGYLETFPSDHQVPYAF